MTGRKHGEEVLPLPEALLRFEALDPDVLSPIANEARRASVEEGASENTKRAYRAALRYWMAWFLSRYQLQLSLPVSVPVVLQFILDHVEVLDEKTKLLASALPAEVDQALVQGGHKAELGALTLTTVIHRVAVLSKAHQLQHAENPCEAVEVRHLLRSSRRARVERGVRPQKKPALTREPLQAMLDTCDGSLRGVRDRALLLFAFCSGGRRRSEVTQATMANVKRVSADAFAFDLAYTQTSLAGTGSPASVKPVEGVAAVALGDWLRMSGIASGPIFRRVRRGGHVGEPLTPSAVRDIVKSRAVMAGLSENFSAHSLRSGFVTEAARQNVPIPETMAMAGRKTVDLLMGDFRTEALLESMGARLMRPK